MPATNLAYRVAKRLISRVPAWLLRFRPYTVYAIPTDKFHEPSGVTPTSTIRWIESVAEVEPLYGSQVAKNFAEWDGVAYRAAVVIDEGAPIACAWVATGSYLERELNLEYQLAADDRWVYATLVLPNHRGRGHYSRLLDFVGSQMRAEGARRVLLGIVTGNQLSERAHSRWQPGGCRQHLCCEIAGRHTLRQQRRGPARGLVAAGVRLARQAPHLLSRSVHPSISASTLSSTEKFDETFCTSSWSSSFSISLSTFLASSLPTSTVSLAR